MPSIVRDPDSYSERVEPKISSLSEEHKGKRVIVLQFGDAHVMLACATKGAEVTGVDFSSEQIRLPRKVAKFCGVNAKLVEADCQNLPKSISNSFFDSAVAAVGIFLWVANLNTWMRNANHVLRRGGQLLAQDFHPISLVAKDWRAKVKKGTVVFGKRYLDRSPEIHHQENNLPPTVYLED